LAALAAAHRAQRPRDLDQSGLVGPGRAPHRGPRRRASRPPLGGSTRSLGPPGAGRAGRRGRRRAARGLLAPGRGAHGAVAPGAALGRSMAELGNRLDADLWLYRGGVLAATTAPVLAELGVVDPFLAPDAFVRLALRDELERTTDSRVAGRTIRVGYLVVVSESPQVQEVLAAPQLLDDERVRQQ